MTLGASTRASVATLPSSKAPLHPHLWEFTSILLLLSVFLIDWYCNANVHARLARHVPPILCLMAPPSGIQPVFLFLAFTPPFLFRTLGSWPFDPCSVHS